MPAGCLLHRSSPAPVKPESSQSCTHCISAFLLASPPFSIHSWLKPAPINHPSISVKLLPGRLVIPSFHSLMTISFDYYDSFPWGIPSTRSPLGSYFLQHQLDHSRHTVPPIACFWIKFKLSGIWFVCHSKNIYRARYTHYFPGITLTLKYNPQSLPSRKHGLAQFLLSLPGWQLKLLSTPLVV